MMYRLGLSYVSVFAALLALSLALSACDDSKSTSDEDTGPSGDSQVADIGITSDGPKAEGSVTDGPVTDTTVSDTSATDTTVTDTTVTDTSGGGDATTTPTERK